VCKLRDKEWKSTPSEKQGLAPVWLNQVMSLPFRDENNFVFIELRDKNRPMGVCAEARAKIKDCMVQG